MNFRRLYQIEALCFGTIIFTLVGCGDSSNQLSSFQDDANSANALSAQLSDSGNSAASVSEPTWQNYSFEEYVKTKNLSKYSKFASASNVTSDLLEPIESKTVNVDGQVRNVSVANLQFRISCDESSDFDHIVSCPDVPCFINDDTVAEYRHREIDFSEFRNKKKFAYFGWGPNKSLSKLVRIASSASNGRVACKIDVYRLPTKPLTLNFEKDIFSKINELLQAGPFADAEYKSPSKLEMSVYENFNPQKNEFETDESYSQRRAKFNKLREHCIANARMGRRRVRVCNIPVETSTQYNMNAKGFHLSTECFDRLLMKISWRAKDYMTFTNAIDTASTNSGAFQGVKIQQSKTVYESGAETSFGFWWPLGVDEAKAFRNSKSQLTAELEFVLSDLGNACLVAAELKNDGHRIQRFSIAN